MLEMAVIIEYVGQYVNICSIGPPKNLSFGTDNYGSREGFQEHKMCSTFLLGKGTDSCHLLYQICRSRDDKQVFLFFTFFGTVCSQRISITFFREEAPLHRIMACLGTLKWCARTSIRASLALPSRAGALTQTRYSPSETFSTFSFLALGRIQTITLIPVILLT